MREPSSASTSGATKVGRSPARTIPSIVLAWTVRCTTTRSPRCAMARQAATLPCEAPLVRNHVRRAPQASAASRRASSYGAPRRRRRRRCPRSASGRRARARRRPAPHAARVRGEAALVPGHHRAARMARGERDQRLEIRRQALAGVLCGRVHRMVERRRPRRDTPGRRHAPGADGARSSARRVGVGLTGGGGDVLEVGLRVAGRSGPPSVTASAWSPALRSMPSLGRRLVRAGRRPSTELPSSGSSASISRGASEPPSSAGTTPSSAVPAHSALLAGLRLVRRGSAALLARLLRALLLVAAGHGVLLVVVSLDEEGLPVAGGAKARAGDAHPPDASLAGRQGGLLLDEEAAVGVAHAEPVADAIAVGEGVALEPFEPLDLVGVLEPRAALRRSPIASLASQERRGVSARKSIRCSRSATRL